MLKKKEIEEWIERNREEIESGKLIVFFADECHLLWGDVCGYVWGKTDRRIDIPMTNEKKKQTYYGALDYRTGKVIVKDYPQGNTENTIKFIKYLQEQHPDVKIAMIWDGASYHRSQEFREYLEEVNQEKTEEEWSITCIRLAPHAPEQNPIEDVWLQGKEFLRKYWHLCKNFKVVQWLFEWSISQDTFRFPKLSMYGSFS